MSGLVLDSEPLNRLLDGRAATAPGCVRIYEEATRDPAGLLAAASRLRLERKGRTMTFSKKAFLNVVNLCRDACSYCTYKAQPGQEKLSMMDMDGVRGTLRMAKKYRCVEALLVTGERPEERYGEARRWLREQGCSSTPEYLARVSEAALEEGLFPHTNAGNLEAGELRLLAETNASVGLMLESSSGRLAERGMAHHLAPSKEPRARMRTLREAGRLRIPTTTGILVGIGESVREDIDSLLAIRDLHARYGHIQEVILQNFRPKGDTAMRGAPAADAARFAVLTALARLIMPDMNIQTPPNLSPATYHEHMDAGINDWGGVSPLTPDFVNPEFAWPAIGELERRCADAGYELRCRFPVYPEFMHMNNGKLRGMMRDMSDGGGLVGEEHWR